MECTEELVEEHSNVVFYEALMDKQDWTSYIDPLVTSLHNFTVVCSIILTYFATIWMPFFLNQLKTSLVVISLSLQLTIHISTRPQFHAKIQFFRQLGITFYQRLYQESKHTPGSAKTISRCLLMCNSKLQRPLYCGPWHHRPHTFIAVMGGIASTGPRYCQYDASL